MSGRGALANRLGTHARTTSRREVEQTAMSEQQPPTERETELAAPARMSRGTLLGCVGLVCILLTLPLLWLAVGVGSGWLAHVLPLLAFATAIGGAALTLRVPSALTARSNDPQRPLTREGAAPAIERPATSANRLAWAFSAALLVCALLGYALEVTRIGVLWGLALMLIAGAVILAQGVLVGWGRQPAPALRWLRVSIYGATARQSGTLLSIGFVTLGGALFLALLDGYVWGPVGLALLVAALVMITPLARRAPRRRGSQRADDSRTGQPD